MDLFRIMVEGEDHTVFCFRNRLTDEELADACDAAQETYPCATITVEEE